VLIVDVQVHIWSSGKPTNPNHRQAPVFSKDDLLKEMDEAGVDVAIIHPPSSWDPESSELAVEAARQRPDRLAILGNFPLDRPESRALIDDWKSRPGMLGL
jgi:predicted TIM-barrel fold metal-dependent hydrolase